MTPEHIAKALFVATTLDYTNSDFGVPTINQQVFAKMIQFAVLDEVLALARANCIVSNDALELYKDLQAYDRYERGLNF